MSVNHVPARVRRLLPVLALAVALLVTTRVGAAPPPPLENVPSAPLDSGSPYAFGQPIAHISPTSAQVPPTRSATSFEPFSDRFSAAQGAPAAGSASPSQSLLVRANRTHDWVQGEAPAQTNIIVTVKRNGATIGTGQSFTGGGTGWNVNPQRPEGGNVDMRTGDIVEVTAGALSASVVLIDMDGAVNSDTDVVSGKLAGVPFPADVQIEVWSDSGQSRNLKTMSDGTFSVDFDAFDIRQGDSVGIWYVRPDGHMVGIVRSDFRLEAAVRDNGIWGMTSPNTRVDLTLLSNSTVKGLATAWSDDEGNFGNRFNTPAGQPANIAAGDVINGAAGGKTATVMVPQPFSASYDHVADAVCGQAPAGTQVQVDLWGYGTQNVTASAAQDYCATFGGDPKIDAAGEASVYLPAGHRALVRFQTPTPALWLDKRSDGAPASGGYHRYTIGVGNDESGDIAASGTVLTDILPAGMSFVSESTGKAAVTGDHVVWTLGTIERGTEREITLTVHVTASSGTQLKNCAEVAGSGWERDLGNNASCEQRQVVEYQSDLSVGGQATPGDPAAGAEYVYQIYYNNNRPAGSRNVKITDTLPAGTTFVSEWNPGGWTVDTSHPGSVVWQADYLAGWTGHRLELRLRTNAGLTRGTPLQNRVEISGDAPDAELGNNTWEHDANVQDPYGNVSVGTGYGNGIPVAGYEYTTWVQVSSQGNVPAAGAVLTDTLPAGATFVRAVQREWNPATDDFDIATPLPPAAQGTGWVRWNLPAVPAWREYRMEVTFQIGASTAIGAELVNRVDAVLSGDQDLNNNHAEYSFRTQAAGPNLRVTKWYDRGDVAPGETVQYQLRFENDGTQPLYGLVFKDILPDHTTLNGFGWNEQPTIEGKTLTWTPNWPMNPGDQQGFWLQVRVDDGTLAGTVLTNTAEGSSSSAEAVATDNVARVLLTVGPDLRVVKELLNEGIRPGQRARYRIRISNAGGASARNIVLTDILPPGLTFVGSDWGGNVQQGNRVVWNIGDRGPGWYGDFEMEVEAAPTLVVGSTVTNRVEITNAQGDAHPGDNAFELASTVGSPYLFRVQESHNRVEGNALPNAPVHIVLKDHAGAVKRTADVTADGEGRFSSNNFPDIVPGDTVEVNTAGSATVSIPVVEIDGAVNPVTDRITGRVHGVSYPAKLVAEVWSENGTIVEGLTDGAGNYDLNLAPFDVRNGQMVALWYVRPDGHQVGIVRQAMFVRVYPADDVLWGMTAPDTEVSITLRDAADHLKGSATVTSGPEGDWNTEIHNGGTRVEIDDHDKVHVVAGGLTADIMIPRITVLPDAAHDKLDVYSELPNTGLQLSWDSSPNLNDHDLARNGNMTTDGAGHASLDVSSVGGLALGVHGNLYYYDADGQCVEPWWRATVELVDPAEIRSTVSHEISIVGVGFLATPTVYLGKHGEKQVQLTNVSLVGTSGTLLKATVPAGTPAGIYELHVYNSDERTGFLAGALTIRGSRVLLPLILGR